jgi:Fe-S-cluster-containing dehydrogenase component
VTALTPKERQGLVKWQLERIVCRECRDPPCSEWCQRRCEAKRFLEIIEEEERRHKRG